MVAGARWVQRAENRHETAEILAQPQYVGEPADVLFRSIGGNFRTGRMGAGGGAAEASDDFHVFAGPGVNRPEHRHAVWFLLELLRWGMLDRPVDVEAVASAVYRPDLYDDAVAAAEAAPGPPALRLFDGHRLDPERPLDYLASCRLHRLRVPMPELAAANAG